jgi:hypothetical protein
MYLDSYRSHDTHLLALHISCLGTKCSYSQLIFLNSQFISTHHPAKTHFDIKLRQQKFMIFNTPLSHCHINYLYVLLIMQTGHLNR